MKNYPSRAVPFSLLGLVVTPEGLPLGLGAVQFRERKQFKGCDERK